MVPLACHGLTSRQGAVATAPWPAAFVKAPTAPAGLIGRAARRRRYRYPDPRVPPRAPVEQTARHQVGNRQIGWRELAERLAKIERDTPPFVSVPRAYQRGARWVGPRLVAEVTFTTWTADHLLCHPSFEGLREDKPAREVTFEWPSHKGS